MRKTLTLSLATIAAFVAGTAYAQDAPRGEMTRAQVERHSAEHFARMDLNGDGLLDEADREAARRRAFDSLDADEDGALNFAEFVAQREKRHEPRVERPGPGGSGETGFAWRGMRGFGGHGMARSADADGDGAVSQAEFASAALSRFDSADADRDGTISLEERRESRHHGRRDMRRGRPGRDAG